MIASATKWNERQKLEYEELNKTVRKQVRESTYTTDCPHRTWWICKYPPTQQTALIRHGGSVNIYLHNRLPSSDMVDDITESEVFSAIRELKQTNPLEQIKLVMIY